MDRNVNSFPVRICGKATGNKTDGTPSRIMYGCTTNPIGPKPHGQQVGGKSPSKMVLKASTPIRVRIEPEAGCSSGGDCPAFEGDLYGLAASITHHQGGRTPPMTERGQANLPSGSGRSPASIHRIVRAFSTDTVAKAMVTQES